MSEHEKIATIVSPIAEEYGVDRVFLFGSRAKGNYNEKSDYDFLISKGTINSLISYVAFIQALEEAFGTHVDVITDTSNDKQFLDRISGEATLIYERQR